MFSRTQNPIWNFIFESSFFLILKNQIYYFFWNPFCFLIKQSDLNFPLGSSFCSLIKKPNFKTLFKNPFVFILKNQNLNFYQKFILPVNRFETSLKKSFLKFRCNFLFIDATNLRFCILTNHRFRNIDTIVCMSFFLLDCN